MKTRTQNKTIYVHLIGPCILCFIVISVYWPVLFNQFLLQWDDGWVPMNLYTEEGFLASNLWNILTTFYHGQYAPVNELFYVALYTIGGKTYNPMVFHTACLLIHLLNTLLVYQFIRKLLQQSKRLEIQSANRIGLMTALLVGIHPFLVEAVAWISASKIVLYILFFLLGMLYYLKYIESGRFRYWLFTLLFFILSFGAKEQAVVMPILMILMDFTLKRNPKKPGIWLEKVPFFLISIAFSALTVLSQGATDSLDSNSYPFYQKIAFAGYSMVEYFTKLLFPIHLSYLYPFPNLPNESLPLKYWLYPLAIAALGIGIWRTVRARPWLTFGIVWFVVGLLPVLHLVSMNRFAIVADRYVYLSSIGIFFLAAYLFDIVIRNRPKYYRIALMTGSLYILVIGSYAHQRSRTWHDSDTLKKHLREQLADRRQNRMCIPNGQALENALKMDHVIHQ